MEKNEKCHEVRLKASCNETPRTVCVGVGVGVGVCVGMCRCVWVSQCDLKHIKNRPRKIKKELEADGKRVLKRKVRHSKRYKTDKSDRV